MKIQQIISYILVLLSFSLFITVQVLNGKQRTLMKKMNLSEDEYKKQYPNKAKTLLILKILFIIIFYPTLYKFIFSN